jgi:hypothetical protein
MLRSLTSVESNGKVCAHLSGDAVYRCESSKVLNNVMRNYQPIWRIRSRMSPL